LPAALVGARFRAGTADAGLARVEPSSAGPGNPSAHAAERHALMSSRNADLLATVRLLALLPGVKPRVAKDRLYAGLLNAVLAQRPSFKLWPCEVQVADCDELFIPDRNGVDRVSAKGAEILLRLYRDGALPMSAKPPSQNVAQVLAYIANGAAKLGKPGSPAQG
jgi:hypothetical protein